MMILDYIPKGAEIGVGLALRMGIDEYVFFLPGARHNNQCNELFYAGVGGHLEPGEDLLQCGRREAWEEIQSEIDYECSKSTLYIDSLKNTRSINVDDDMKPLAIFEMIHPQGTPNAGKIYHIVIYKALLDIEPSRFQFEEVSAIILLNKAQVLTGNRRASIGQLLGEGARIIGRDVTPETVIYPIGTAEALTFMGNLL